MLLFMFCVCSCGNDYAGTYQVHKKEGYITPAFNLVINKDGSVRVNVDGKGESYGSWIEYDDGVWIELDEDFHFIFGFYRPFLDTKANRLYVSLDAYNSKNPNKCYKVTKK